MRAKSYIRMPQWNEKKVLKCKKCGYRFSGIKILLFSKCPDCGSCRIIKDPHIRYKDYPVGL